MINAKLFADGDQGETTKYMESNFNQELGEGVRRLQCVQDRDELIVVLFGLWSEEEGSNAVLPHFNVSDRPLIVQVSSHSLLDNGDHDHNNELIFWLSHRTFRPTNSSAQTIPSSSSERR
jgi:hypothetical protein